MFVFSRANFWCRIGASPNSCFAGPGFRVIAGRMQNVVSDQPYRFVPAHRTWFWTSLFLFLLPRAMRKNWGVGRFDLRGGAKLKASLDAGHAVVLAPNHSRPCDPPVAAMLTRSIGVWPYAMASHHLFREDRFHNFLFPRIGVFSLHRESVDREAIKFAAHLLCDQPNAPLMLFPEGVTTRTNDRIKALMDGPVFIARTALKLKNWRPGRRLVIHPMAIRYFFDAPAARLPEVLAGSLAGLEAVLALAGGAALPLPARIARLEAAALARHETEHLGAPRQGTVAARRDALIERLLGVAEAEWLRGRKPDGDTLTRVKTLRTAILHDMVQGLVTPEERARRWTQLRTLDLAQELSFFPDDHSGENATPESLIEAVERLQENLTGKVSVHGPLRAVVEVLDPIEVTAERVRGEDPVMVRLHADLQSAVIRLREEASPSADAR